METELVHVGFDNFVPINRVIAVLSRSSPPSEPIKRMIDQGKAEGKVIDMTRGRKTKTVLIMDSGHIVLTAIAPETIVGRLVAMRGGKAK
jgi:hypothetical protein